jgi:acyl-CoA synthetase (NDP forming)
VVESGRIPAYFDSLNLNLTLDEGAVRLNEAEVYGLLDVLGIDRCPSEFLAHGSSELQLSDWAVRAASLADDQGRLLLKIVGREILHKTEAGGVAIIRLLDVEDKPGELRRAVGTLVEKVKTAGLGKKIEGVLAGAFVAHQPNCPGQEVLLSLRQDPAFGACVVVGIGGTLTEWYGKIGQSTLILPAVGLDFESVDAAVTAHPALNLLISPSRLYIEPPVPRDRLVGAIMALAGLAQSCSPTGDATWTMEELEINPAVASEGTLVALDGVGLVSRRRWPAAGRTVSRIVPLLDPKSAVVLGVSAKGANPGRIILDNLRRSPGVDSSRLYVVHHEAKEIDGVPCFPSVGDLPEKVDLAVVSVPAEGAFAAISDLVTQDRSEAIILIPGGFAEAGATDLAERIEKVLADGHARPGGGPVLVGGNCLGIVSRDRYNTFFLPEYKLPFRPGLGENLAVVCQSGAYLVSFASNYDGVIQPAASISFGNQMDLTAGDFLEHFTDREDIDVIAVYVEGFRPGDGARFCEAARVAREKGKRVIAFKAGKTPLGAKAAASHTASLAGDYAVAQACLENAGVTVAATLDEFEDLIKTFTLLAQRPAAGNRVGIISNAGFECSAVMDRLEGLSLAAFDDGTRAKLDEILPGFAHRDNPIDCTPMTGTQAFTESCRAILDCPGVDLAILSSVPVTPALDNLPADPDGKHRENLAGPESQVSLTIDIVGGSAKPAVVVVDSGVIYDPMCRAIESAGIPVFRKIDRAAAALAAFCHREMG